MNVCLKNMKSDDKFGILLFVLGLCFTFYLTYTCFHYIQIWGDEIYTLVMLNSPLSDMINIGVGDVHPLLYYFMYKSFLKPVAFLITNYNPIIVGKLLSIIPLYLMLILGATKIRKNFGWLTAGIFALCIVCMPQLMNFYTQLRMYSWALFFVTASFVYIWEIINNESIYKNWGVLILLTICSVYTHYFSGIASFILYLFLFVYLIKNNKKDLKKWIFATVVPILAFMPWCFILFGQMARVHSGYWITSLTPDTAIVYLWFVLSPGNKILNGLPVPYTPPLLYLILAIILLIAILSLIVVFIRNKKSFEEKYAVVGMSVIACVFILGLIASLVYRPILHPRYLIPSFGCLWLGISILLSRNFEKKKLFVPIVILLLVVGSISTINFEIQQEKNYQLTLDTTQIINELDGNCNIIMYRGVIDYGINQWLDHNNHYVGVGYELDRNLTQLYGRLIDILSDPGVQNEMSHGSKAYYVFENNTKNTSVFEFNDTDQLKFTEIPNRLNDKMIIYEVQLK